jgi:membrane protein DedA with SNARE-associated domain
VSDAKLLYVEHKFKKYGSWVIIIGRHIPGLRIPITVFSGISGVSFRTLFWSTFASVIFWIPAYLEVGRRLGKRATSLLQAHQDYYLLALIPLAIFILSLTTDHIRHVRKKK